MFDRVKLAFRLTKNLTRLEQAQNYDLNDKPFTKALILRASHYQDDGIRNIKKMVGRIGPIKKDKTIEEFAASCAATIAHDITIKAVEHNNLSAVFPPNKSVPKYSSKVLAFSLLIISGINFGLKEEGIDLNFREVAISATKLFFMLHLAEDITQYLNKGFQEFYTITQSNDLNYTEWHNHISELIPIYVCQWTSDNEELRNTDLIPAFGFLISSLLKASD